MTVSLIISTYNWPRALYLCLDSVMQQTVMPSEILIADDGSGMSTRDVVKHFENISPVPVRHIWHEDNGFRLAAIRNKAIAASKGKYIIQIDGDLILQRNFIQDHMLFAREGCFVTGSRGIITELLTRKVLSGEITSLSPLMKGIRSSNNVVRIPIMSILYHTFGPTRAPRGCNMAFWRNDLIRVNGYDEDFKGWGFEDAELCIRLNNSEIHQRCMKFRGVAFLPRKYPTRPAEGRPSSSAADPVRCEFAARYFSNDDFSGKRVSRNVRTRIRSSSVIRTSSFRQNNDGSYFSIIDSRLGR